MTDFWTTADEIPALLGAYVLVISLSELVVVSICRKPSAPLAPGCYFYCGSAKGPGGLAARLARHMRQGNANRWHVDNLTEAGTVLGAWTFPADTNVISSPSFHVNRRPTPEGDRSLLCRTSVA
jgi:Uri superfamily endonuclease